MLDFWRCAMLPLRDSGRQTRARRRPDSAGHDPAGQEAGRHDPAALVGDWRLDLFARQAGGPRLAELRAGQSWAVPGGDVVSPRPSWPG